SYYLIGLWSQGTTAKLTMQLFAFGGGAPAGTLDSNFTPDPNVWYQFRIQADDAAGKSGIRARFWTDGSAEPQQWSIDASDAAAGRLTSGRIGFWAAAKGDEYLDDLSAKSPVDNAPPSIAFFDVDAQKMLDPAALALFRHPAHIEIRGTDDTSTPTITATLDNAPFASGTAIAIDGTHALAAHAVDGSGNTADATLHLLLDQVPPVVTLLGDNAALTDGKIFPESVTITANVTDATPVTTTGSLDGAAAVLLPIVAVQEKLHSVAVRAVDQTGNETLVTRGFTIDKTAPVITVTANGAPLGASYQMDVTLDWTVDDLTLDTVTATLDDAPIAKGAVVRSEQIHHLVIVANDKATHSTTLDSHFALEKNAPQVTLLANGAPFVAGKSYAEPVRFTLDIHSATPPTTDIRVDGAAYTLNTPIASQQQHTVQVTVTNAAQIPTSIGPSTFSVDTTFPVVTLTEGGTPFVNGRPFNRDVVPVVTATDNLTTSPTITLLVDGIAAEPGATITAEKAEHTIAATAVDDAGNSTTAGPFTFVLDKTRPVVTIVDAATNAPFAADALFRVPVTVKVLVTDLTTPTLQATLDGAAISFGTPTKRSDGTFVFTSAAIATEQLHKLSVVATDAVLNA
ncbi:MAG TPA: hypothetical protein VN605_03250, partial [Thermoanaerobaculia bacterium]|nr:hypothetical protein [Thermoanaerobaculia bacterium]